MMERKFWGLTIADVMCLAYQLVVRNRIKNKFCTGNEKTGRKLLNNLLRRHQETSVTTPEILHCQERGVSLLNQYIIIFKATNPLCTPFNIILQDLTNATKPAPLLYSTTHENIRIERLASDIFCSIRRTGFSYDSRQQYESPGQFIPPLPVFPRKYMKSELMNDTRPGSIHA